jgi:hypothetical protein
VEQCPQIRRPSRWLTGLGPPVVFTARWGAAFTATLSCTARYLLGTDEGYRAAPITSGSLDRVGVKNRHRFLVLDLMQGHRRACMRLRRAVLNELTSIYADARSLASVSLRGAQRQAAEGSVAWVGGVAHCGQHHRSRQQSRGRGAE